MTTLDGYVEQAKQFVQQTFPGAIVLESRQGMLTYHIGSQNMQWSYVFGALESQKQRLGIVDYSVSQTTLEQVRVHVFTVREVRNFWFINYNICSQ